jgi:hypothetical protein
VHDDLSRLLTAIISMSKFRNCHYIGKKSLGRDKEILFTCLSDEESHSCITELFNPTAMCLPSGAQLTLVTGPSSSSAISSSDIELFEASHKYTVLPRAMDNTLFKLQSSRFK